MTAAGAGAPQIYQIVDVGQVSIGSAQGWRIDYVRPDSVRWCHVINNSLMRWRAAEYGVDLNDANTLLTIALYEQHIQLDPNDPTFLYNTDEETARLAHLARVKVSQQQIVYADPRGLLAQIRQHHLSNIDIANHAEKVAMVASMRAQRMRGLTRG